MTADRVRLPLNFDVERMQQDLQTLQSSEEWIAHFVQQNYEGDWSVIPLRGQAGATHPVMMIYSNPGCDAYEDTPFLERCEYLPEVLRAFQCELQAVRLMKLAAGSRIKPHSDYDLDVESGTVRIHVPITTNDAVNFYLNNSVVDMHPGECWYLRLSDEHRVDNLGETDRVNLVIDARVNSWLSEMLRV